MNRSEVAKGQGGRAFTVTRKVRFEHCDPAGIVFYPRYFEMVNATVEDWFEARLDLPFSRMHGSEAHGVPTVSISAAFTAPSRLGERLDFTLRPVRLGRSSLDLGIEAECAGERRLQVEATLVHVSLGEGCAVPWPAPVRRRIEDELQGEGVDGA